jgi:hypothetical protein
VSSRCSTASQNALAEITTAVQIYNGYCEAAVGVTFPVVASTLAVTTVGSQSGSGSTRTSGSEPVETGISSSGGSKTSEASVTQTSAGNGATTPSSSTTSLGGLSGSDKIALGVGLGMGLPSIALAAATFWLMKRRRHNASAVE